MVDLEKLKMKEIEIMNKTLVHHHTKSFHRNKIIDDGIIKLEGCGFEDKIKNYPYIPLSKGEKEVWELLKKQYKLTGQYVWLTEENHAHCTNYGYPFETFSFFLLSSYSLLS